jgi:hypothetical protein
MAIWGESDEPRWRAAISSLQKVPGGDDSIERLKAYKHFLDRIGNNTNPTIEQMNDEHVGALSKAFDDLGAMHGVPTEPIE